MNYQSIGVQMALIHELNRLRHCGIWESCLLLVVLIDKPQQCLFGNECSCLKDELNTLQF